MIAESTLLLLRCVGLGGKSALLPRSVVGLGREAALLLRSRVGFGRRVAAAARCRSRSAGGDAAGRNDVGSVADAGLGGHGRAAVVDRGELGAVLAGVGLMSDLVGGGLEVLLADGCLLLLGGTGLRTVVAAVVANAVDRGVVIDDHGLVVDVVNVGGVDVGDGAVVGEDTVVPVTALVAIAA